MKKTIAIIATVSMMAMVFTGCMSVGGGRPVLDGLVYYVDAGDDSPFLLESGEFFGEYNSAEDQEYGLDPDTGKTWGYYGFGSTYSEDNGETWGESIRTDEGDTGGEGLTYAFEIENGTYNVEIGFNDIWVNENRYMNIFVQGELIAENYVAVDIEDILMAEAVVTEGELVVEIKRTPLNTGEYEDPIVNMIAVKRQ